MRLHLADQGDQRLARGFAFGEAPVADCHCEGVAAGWDPPGEVLGDRLNPAGRVFEPLFAGTLIVDEMQEFRKLSFATNQTTLKGIDPEGSQRAWDLYVKVRFIDFDERIRDER